MWFCLQGSMLFHYHCSHVAFSKVEFLKYGLQKKAASMSFHSCVENKQAKYTTQALLPFSPPPLPLAFERESSVWTQSY